MLGIVSINKYSKHMNYGAALHSYAFQKFLDKQGIQNVIIDYFPKFMEGYHLKYPILNARNFRNTVRWTLDFRSNLIKYRKFQNFFKARCRFTDFTLTSDTLDSNLLDSIKIDAFICESDVIWKPATTKWVDPGYFLHFNAADKCDKKISYAASVGLQMNNREKEIAKEWLQKFSAISVREKDSVSFIQDLVGSHPRVQWVIDPTVLLSKEDYRDIIIPPKEKNYLLVYNCTLNNREMLRIAENTAKKLDLEMIEISAFRHNQLFFNHKIKTDVGIEEFLGYFANAQFVMCNAFHGSCFSVLFGKPFYLFQREKYDYRMKSLIEPLGLTSIYVPRKSWKKINDLPIPELNYDSIYEKLNTFRIASKDFLLNAIRE